MASSLGTAPPGQRCAGHVIRWGVSGSASEFFKFKRLQVRNGNPFITKIGAFDVELAAAVGGCRLCLHAIVPDQQCCKVGESPPSRHTAPLPSCVQGSVLLTRQQDKPGIVASVTTQLAKDDVNISFMTVGRSGKGQVRAETRNQCV